MACGCRKNRNNRRVRAKKIEREKLGVRLAAASKTREEKFARKKLVTKKFSFCKTCIHSRQNKEERRKRVRICHKLNMNLQSIVNDKKTTCPIGNF